MVLCSPAIVLVRPQMGENIGAAARAMMNFGLSDLRIVAPRDGWPNAKAREMAAHAEDLVDSATLYDTLQEALHDCHFALATSARRRDLPLPTHNAATAAQLVHSIPHRSAFVFGQENNGLTNEDIACCHAILTLETAPQYASLNLAQCVMLVAYEWFQRPSEGVVAEASAAVPASVGEVDALHARLCCALENTAYFTPDKAAWQRTQLRRILTSAAFASEDIHALHGVVKAIIAQKTS
jgi:tRNA/rRNA methyltransferase